MQCIVTVFHGLQACSNWHIPVFHFASLTITYTATQSSSSKKCFVKPIEQVCLAQLQSKYLQYSSTASTYIKCSSAHTQHHVSFFLFEYPFTLANSLHRTSFSGSNNAATESIYLVKSLYSSTMARSLRHESSLKDLSNTAH